jgi:periplasmic protein TonB
MFTNLIESDSHRKEFKRRSSFFAATVAAYTVLLFGAAVAGVLTYDARVEAQTNSLELLEWIPPVKSTDGPKKPTEPKPASKPRKTNAPEDPNLTREMRTAPPVEPVTDPTKTPETIGTTASTVPPATGQVDIGPKNASPPSEPSGSGNEKGSGNSTGGTTPPKVEDPPREETVRPSTLKVSSGVMVSKIVSLPKPVYPIIAKNIRAQGPVNVQILVNEDGKVISAQAVNGHPALTRAAVDAALRARFTPTMLSNQPVKVQGVITYNFVLQ